MVLVPIFVYFAEAIPFLSIYSHYGSVFWWHAGCSALGYGCFHMCYIFFLRKLSTLHYGYTSALMVLLAIVGCAIVLLNLKLSVVTWMAVILGMQALFLIDEDTPHSSSMHHTWSRRAKTWIIILSLVITVGTAVVVVASPHVQIHPYTQDNTPHIQDNTPHTPADEPTVINPERQEPEVQPSPPRKVKPGVAPPQRPKVAPPHPSYHVKL